MNRIFYFGDNLAALRSLPDDCVDMVYCDPPFNNFSKKIFDFPDSWSGEIGQFPSDVEPIMKVIEMSHGKSMMSYIAMLSIRMKELSRIVMNGSIWIHCDDFSVAYIKLMMDFFFGPCSSHVIWRRCRSHGRAKKNLGRILDHILLYRAGDFTWNTPYDPLKVELFRFDDEDGRGPYRIVPLIGVRDNPYNTATNYTYKGRRAPYGNWRILKENMEALDNDGRLYFPEGGLRIYKKQYMSESPGHLVSNFWDGIYISKSEMVGYQTQKPLLLMERIILSSTNEGDVVLDPFAGCSTTCIAAEKLGRRWIAMDENDLALERSLDRFYNEDIEVEVIQ